MKPPLPLVVLSTDLKLLLGHPTFAVAQKYADPLLDIAGCLPLLMPSLGARLPLEDLLDTVDGLLFTGSPSNVEPRHYGETLDDPMLPSDPARDATTLPLIRAAIARGVPVFGICRGFQEINVALGGTLLQRVHRTEGYADHRENDTLSLEDQYGPAHDLVAVRGGRLEAMVGAPSWKVNSLHGQGIKTLAPPLQPEAHAPDGLVEAYTLRDGSSFLLGVQWHPEWQAASNPVSRALFSAFGDACRVRARSRREQLSAAEA